MKSIFTKYLLIGLALMVLVLPCACAKPQQSLPSSQPRPSLPSSVSELSPPPSPPEFELSSLDIIPTETLVDEPVTISVEVSNTGGTEGTYPVTMTIDGIKIETRVLRIAPESTELVSFVVIKDAAGNYNVQVNDLSGTFRVLRPAEFFVSNLLIAPCTAEAGQTVTATVDVSNSGEIEGSYLVALKINGVEVETKEVTIAPGVSQTVSFAFAKDTAGRYTIQVDEVTSVLEVRVFTDTLRQLKVAYPELFQELLKLPDLEEIDAKDDEAIKDIAHLASNPKYKPAFESMLDEGIGDKRKYCTPLQGLLWVAYDRGFDGYNPLKNYSLTGLIENAWKNTTTSQSYASERWQNFNEVVDRLSSPKLVEIYMQDNLSYSYTLYEAEGVKSAKQIFDDKKGACYDHALLAGYCLKKNGYDKAWGAAVKFDRIVRGYFGGHIGCIYQDPKDTLYYAMDFGFWGSGGYRVYGSFTSADVAASHICKVGSGGVARLASYSLHDIDLESGRYKTTWW